MKTLKFNKYSLGSKLCEIGPIKKSKNINLFISFTNYTFIAAFKINREQQKTDSS